METLADRVRLAMERRGLGFNELGRKMGKRPGYVSALVKDGRQPRSDNVARLAEALEVRLEWLLRGEPPMEAEQPAQAVPERTVELDVTDIPRNLAGIMRTTAWDRASDEVRRRVLDEVRRFGGDLEPEDWIAEIKRHEREAKRGTPAGVSTDALGRPVGEPDVVEDDEDER